MDLVTAEEMRRLDRMTIEKLGIPAIALMENAGRAIAEEVIAFCRSRQYSCGPGWYGGRADGYGQSMESDIVCRTGGYGRSTIGGEPNLGPAGNGAGGIEASAAYVNGGWNAGAGGSVGVGGSGNAGVGGSGNAGVGGSGNAGIGVSWNAGVGGSGNAGVGGSGNAGVGGSWNAGVGVSWNAGVGGSWDAGVGGSWDAGVGGSGSGGAQPPRDFRVSGDRALTLETAAAEHWLILAGKGNNGGDGLAAARHLREAGIAVTLVYAAAPETLAGEAAVQRSAAAALEIPAAVHGRDAIDFAGCTGIVDALLGTGSAGAPRGAYAALIAAANASGKPVVSADIPSGLDADTGELHEPCIHAAVTVCLALLKRGLVQYPGAEAAGRVVVRSIGIPAALAREAGVQASLLTPEVLQTRLRVDVSRRRSPEGHKGTYGHVLLAAGSLSMSGAGLLAARAALRAGCGLVTWALPAALMPYVIGAAPEIMLAAAGGGEDGTWNAGTAAEVLRLSSKRDVVAAGPGLGRFTGDKEWLRMLWEGVQSPLVLDADALNILAECDYTGWTGPVRPVILTPHPGEMARLAGVSTAEVQRDRIGLARNYAVKHGVILVLKGSHTVIASPQGEIYVNATGHPGMGTGGAGDVLTGMIAGLLAQSLDAVQAAAFGVYLHGLAGERAAGARNHPSALVAGDIIEAL